jgi:hypothetical protein
MYACGLAGLIKCPEVPNMAGQGFSMQADQERQTMNAVFSWLKERTT